jgi:hypothetical protein
MDPGDNETVKIKCAYVRGILLLLAVSVFYLCKYSVLGKVRSGTARRSTAFWGLTPCSLVEVNPLFAHDSAPYRFVNHNCHVTDLVNYLERNGYYMYHPIQH